MENQIIRSISKVEQLRQVVLKDIRDGAYHVNEKVPSIVELANRYGVSKHTVSQALSNLAVEGFLRSEHGKGTFLVKNRIAPARNYIGIIFPYTIEGNYLKETVVWLQRRARIEGYECMFHFGDEDNSAKEQSFIEGFLERKAEGLIIYPVADNENKTNIMELEKRKIPYVLIDKYFEDINSNYVGLDEIEASRLLIDYLVKLGHRRIGFITNKIFHSAHKNRLEGYKKALMFSGVGLDEGLIYKSDAGRDFVKVGQEGVLHFLGQTSAPTACVCVNMGVAFGVYAGLKEKGKSVPKDFSVVTYEAESTIILSPLTTGVVFSMRELGEKSMELLIRGITRKDRRTEHVFLRPTLKIRESCQAVSDQEKR